MSGNLAILTKYIDNNAMDLGLLCYFYYSSYVNKDLNTMWYIFIVNL